MIEEERLKKKKEKEEQTFLEYFIISMLEKCAATALEMAFQQLFGENQKQAKYTELEQSIIDQLEGIAEEEIENTLSEMGFEIV